jgi:hypothetical protein
MLGHNDFVKRYEKVEIFIGSPGGVDFIQEKLKEGKKVQKIQ